MSEKFTKPASEKSSAKPNRARNHAHRKENSQKSKTASKEPKEDTVLQSIRLAQERRWHGRNPECHQCSLSYEGINGTYCNKLNRNVEYGKGDCDR